MQGTCEGFEYPRSDLPKQVQFIGPILPQAEANFQPPEWWSELESGVPVIHVTQGTIANEDFNTLIIPTIKALANEKVLVIAATGNKPVDSIAKLLPKNARVVPYISYSHFLPKVDVMVTNGGYGGVQYAISQGVPVIGAGRTEDKPDVSPGGIGRGWH